jgi:hypothetical protein
MTTTQARSIVRDMIRNANVRRHNGECQVVRRHVIHHEAVDVIGRGKNWQQAISRAFDHELEVLADAFDN